MELIVEILSGGMSSESKLLKMVKPTKDPKQAKSGGKDGKTAAGGGAQGPAAGGATEADKGQAAEVMPVEAPPQVAASFFPKEFLVIQRWSWRVFVPTTDKHKLLIGLLGTEWIGICFCLIYLLAK